MDDNWAIIHVPIKARYVRAISNDDEMREMEEWFDAAQVSMMNLLTKKLQNGYRIVYCYNDASLNPTGNKYDNRVQEYVVYHLVRY